MILRKLRVPGSLRKILAVIALFSFSSAYAQEGKTILVLDASGSMWGKVEDGFKIKIAQDVINDLLETLPAEQELGLITYGHRRKGDCGDIEMLVPPGAGTRGAISNAVKSLNPTGKTPLSAAVLQAADELRIEENAATVILLSDGRETCDLDPCAVGSELEDRGIDFTAHVIGFDIEEEQDRDQLRCLAENTGGKFLTASTATELNQALATVSKPIEPLIMSATVKDDEDARILEGLTWSLLPSSADVNSATDGSSLVPAQQLNANALRVSLEPGKYTLSVTREEDGASTSLDINIQNDRSNQYELVLPSIELLVTLTAPESVVIGEKFNVEWEGKYIAGDKMRLALPDSPVDKSVISMNPGIDGTTEMQAPSEAGEYEIRYFYQAKKKILATAVLIVEEAPATVTADATGPQATSILVEWTGPDNQLDYIAVAKPGEKEPIALARTRDGSPLKVQMPPETGEYELRYVLYKDHVTLTTRPITIVEADVSFESPETAGLGKRISVPWTGPDEQFDHIAVVDVATDKVITQAYMSWGNPVDVEMPAKTGDYELRYISNEFNAVLATRPITVTDIEVSLNAPETASVGETIKVDWAGPDEANDLIVIGEIGDDKRYDLSYTKRGSPLEIQMPPKPGNYELRYVLNQGNTVLATRPITVTEATVSLSAPETASVGETIKVEWVGPDEANDAVVIGEIGNDKRYDLSYTKRGSPLEIQMPTKPGEYELRYILYQGRTVLATRPITVTEATVSLSAPDEASVGETIKVEWVGPDGTNDLIVIGEVGDDKRYNSSYTRKGSPLEIQMPTKPGEYELRYILNQGRTVLATRPITVTKANVSLSAPETASVGESIKVEWVGPDEANDLIVIGEIGDDKHYNSSRTRKGSPLEIQMPTKPGEYELRYVLRQGRTVLATRPITVTEATVLLSAPDEAGVGQSVTITWEGPDAHRDRIAVAKIGEKKSIKSTPTRQGNPLKIQMPTEPGEYELRYVLHQDKTILATRPITVTQTEVSIEAPNEAGIGE